MPKRKRSPARKQKPKPTLGQHKRIFAVLLVLIVAFSAAFVSYGLANKPIVEYTFGAAADVRQNYELHALTPTHAGTIDIALVRVRNSGSADISVIVTLHAVNAEVSTGYDGPYDDNVGYQITLPANTDYRFVTFYITLISQAPSFTLSATVSTVYDYSTISSTIASAFTEVDGIPFTTLQYAQSGTPDNYQLVQPS